MTTLRKRKQLEVEEVLDSKHTHNIQQSSVDSTKTRNAGNALRQKRRKTGHERQATPQPESVASTSSTKRKRLESVSEDAEETVNSSTKPQERFFARFTTPRVNPTTPQPQRQYDALPMSPAQTPAKRAAQLFDRLNLRATSPIPVPPNKKQRSLDTPPATPETDRAAHFVDLPEELQDFAHLYSAFLTAVGLQYAHNRGSSTPINVKILCTAVTANWRKRTVTAADIRKLLGQQGSPPTFLLEDRARAGMFLAKAPNSDFLANPSKFIDATRLSAEFEARLQKAWTIYCADTPSTLCTARAFLRQLPLVDAQKHESAEKAGPLYAKGEQRLADLKSGQAASKLVQEAEKVAVQPQEKSAAGVQNRGTSLLDRIIAKQRLAATHPAGPTPEELERKSALHRVEDVARVLEMLAGSRPRASFAMQALLQDLRQSLRNPISREEAESCLTIMAKEIMPSFVSLLNGSVKGVVVTRQGKLGLADLKQKLADAGA